MKYVEKEQHPVEAWQFQLAAPLPDWLREAFARGRAMWGKRERDLIILMGKRAILQAVPGTWIVYDGERDELRAIPEHLFHEWYAPYQSPDVIADAAEANGPPGYQQRVLAEFRDLREKRLRLAMFVASVQSDSLPDEEKNLLAAQLHHMSGYFDALKQRLERWGILPPQYKGE